MASHFLTLIVRAFGSTSEFVFNNNDEGKPQDTICKQFVEYTFSLGLDFAKQFQSSHADIQKLYAPASYLLNHFPYSVIDDSVSDSCTMAFTTATAILAVRQHTICNNDKVDALDIHLKKFKFVSGKRFLLFRSHNDEFRGRKSVKIHQNSALKLISTTVLKKSNRRSYRQRDFSTQI